MMGGPEAARWHRAAPRLDIAGAVLERMVDAALPGNRVARCERLTEGLRNANFKLTLDGRAAPVVLRVYEHDASLCAKEVDLMRMVRGRVATPEVLYADWEGTPPFRITEFVEGVTFRAVRKSREGEAIASCAFAAGETLAAIGKLEFARGGWLGAGAQVGAPLLEGRDPAPRFLDLCLDSPRLQRWMDADMRQRVHDFAWAHGEEFAEMDAERRLVHGDFGSRNIVMSKLGGTWRVAAVLDWEYAISGTPLMDLGHFLRYDNSFADEFARGYGNGGGRLREDWRSRARLADLAGMCESLTHEFLPADAAGELLELVAASVHAA